MQDVALATVDEPRLNYGVNPRLVQAVRTALDTAWQDWSLDEAGRREAQAYCQAIQIVVTGGFTAEKIAWFEAENVPADIYGVGSSLLANDKATNTDFSADIVRVKVGGQWHDVAKVGRQACTNPDLEPITW